MHSMIPTSTSNAVGAKKPAATTIGPIVDAKLYAGPIDAEESAEISKNPSTRGRCRPADAIGRSRVILSLSKDNERRDSDR